MRTLSAVRPRESGGTQFLLIADSGNETERCMNEISKGVESNHQKDAQEYAWNHFAYHAQQRQTVFNFYLLLVGGCIAAYASTLGDTGVDYDRFRTFMGAVLAAASLLFWRLDRRNATLVKIAETALEIIETRLAEQIGSRKILLMHIAGRKTSRFPLSAIETFGQIYRVIFVCGGLVGIYMTAHSLHYLS
jgi:hypothetical protein